LRTDPSVSTATTSTPDTDRVMGSQYQSLADQTPGWDVVLAVLEFGTRDGCPSRHMAQHMDDAKPVTSQAGL